jgi:hypothetical protein
MQHWRFSGLAYEQYCSSTAVLVVGQMFNDGSVVVHARTEVQTFDTTRTGHHDHTDASKNGQAQSIINLAGAHVDDVDRSA